MSGEDAEPLVQFEDNDDDDMEHDDFDPYKGMKRANTRGGWPSGWLGKVTLIILAVMIGASLFIALVAVILGAVGINKGSPTPSSDGFNVLPTMNPTGKPVLVENPNCGDGLWNRVIYINMNDSSQECPQGWRGYDGPVRCCGRPVLARSSCPSAYFSANGYQYGKVCGRAIGYQQGSPDAFASNDSREPQETINGIYVDGVSLTHGNPRTHIWTFAAGLLEKETSPTNNNHRCPCDNGQVSPDFVGNHFFCETGNHDSTHNQSRFYWEDPLWNGKGCVSSACCGYNKPPWFKVKLPVATTHDIEVRICGDQSTGDEDTPIALLEVYVQK